MKTILVTGAARGIGRVTALELAGAGWHVFAGVRSEADGASLAAATSGSLTPVLLDVTDADQVAALDGVLPDRLDAVVNNAGIVVDGPVETLSAEALQKQFDVNVFGAMAVTRAVLPRIRRAQGRIVFVSSVSGRVSTPWMGAYCASKFALEGLVDALRMELRPWKIGVSLVEPGATATDIWGGVNEQVDATVTELNDEQKSLYAKHIRGVRRVMPMMQKQAVPASKVSAVIIAALTARRPKARYPVGASSTVQIALTTITPTRLTDLTLATAMGIPRRPPRA
ncbi:short-chain dehydrogenase [Rhodococcoides trifolii]|uniref:Short-chain dehydrogenase n=1 Tax=Rhodococcoides trifolii TaxID=908250 RepID=A0A917CLR4_9NOCA|nr:SDR family oxidoreductase [Rhodococcus trifolii]GGF92595.1 short-chain dehydrogenase [Rhodococcus trifolii]